MIGPGVVREGAEQETGIRHFSRLAYPDKLAPFEDQVSLSTFALPAVERLASWVTAGAITKLRALPEDERLAMRAGYDDVVRARERWETGLRDPVISDANGRGRGLIESVKIDERIVARMASGTDRYAPITPPERFEIVPPQAHGEHAPLAESDPGNPIGLRARDMGPIGTLGAPFRRVIGANYLQPIVEIRKPPSRLRLDSLHMFAPLLQPRGHYLPTVEFTAAPGPNHGTAALSLVRRQEAPPVTAGRGIGC